MKRGLICILIVFAIMLTLSPTTVLAASKAAKTYDKAQDALIDGEYQKAAELFESISSYEDAAQYALYAKALWYGADEKYDDALKTLAFLGDFKDSFQLINYYTICKLSTSTTINDVLDAAEQFDAISAYRDSAHRADACRQTVYDEAMYRYNTSDYDTARRIFVSLGTYKDSSNRVKECDIAIAEKKNADAYSAAEELLSKGEYDNAISRFEALGEYADAPDRVDDAIEAKVESLLANEEYDKAIKALKMLNGRRNSDTRIEEIIESRNAVAYAKAEGFFADEEYDIAIEAFRALKDYRDSEARMNDALQAAYNHAISLSEEKRFDEAVSAFKSLGNYKDSEEKVNETLYSQACYYLDNNKFEKAAEIFSYLGNYKDSSDKEIETWNRCTGNLKIGDHVTMGNYSSKETGYESQYMGEVRTFAYSGTSIGKDGPIEWIVVDIDYSKLQAVLICNDVLVKRAFARHIQDTWRDSILREHLVLFQRKSFSSAELERMIERELEIKTLVSVSTVTDKITFLSVEEAQNYYKVSSEWCENAKCPFWLREKTNKENVYIMNPDGTVSTACWYDDSIGVKPVIFVDMVDYLHW